MRYYSTKHLVPKTDLREAVTQGLAKDNGLYMPERIPTLPASFFETIHEKSFQEIGYTVASAFFGNDLNANDLKKLVYDALNFDVPLVPVRESIYSLELFHGPTLAFKDVGARFMARLLGYFTQQNKGTINVLVATSGDTGSAVANGFYKVPGINVYILYPKGLVSNMQEKQFTTLGENITALEIDGTFDDCQRMVKQAFLDKDLSGALTLTSANSINLSRLLPQSFYYFYAYAQLSPNEREKVIFSVPSGNFGNLCAGLIAKRMGLPVHRFIAATNINDIVPQYLDNGCFSPRASKSTIANAMDVGNPSNFDRILDLYENSYDAICKDMVGYSYTDDKIRETMKHVFEKYHYMLDPHGAVGYKALSAHLKREQATAGIFMETAHPAKFIETVEETLGQKIEIPERLQQLVGGDKQSLPMSSKFDDLKAYLLTRK